MILYRMAVCCAVVGALLGAPRVAQAEKLVKAEFWSLTSDGNKDHDSGVFVKVLTADEKTELAHIENADCTGDGSGEYKDGSEHTLKLVVSSDGATVAQCSAFKFKIGLRANGKDKWRVQRAKVTLYFDNGQTLVAEMGSTTLESKNSSYVETGWAGAK